MTEKEKAALGQMYDANNDPDLIQERIECRELCSEYNRINHSKVTEKDALIKKIFGKTGKTVLVESPFMCDYGYNIEVGENFYMNNNCTILDGAKVTFGDHVFIGPNCGFYAAGHPLDVSQRNQGLEYAYPITVGNNVWFGGHVVVVPGVTIGDNTVIGAGSVVTKDIPSGVLAAGNPCRVIRKLEKESH